MAILRILMLAVCMNIVSAYIVQQICPPGCVCDMNFDHDALFCNKVNLTQVGLSILQGLRDLNCQMQFEKGKSDANILVARYTDHFIRSLG
ncbi:hypothetical protein L9F63_017909, partial [Diploptera punctata]